MLQYDFWQQDFSVWGEAFHLSDQWLMSVVFRKPIWKLIEIFNFEMLYACVILFNFSIFLNVCIYSIYSVLTYSCSYFFLCVSRFG